MKKMTKSIISMLLSITLLFLATVPVFAAGEVEEEYLSDLRIIYAESFEEAVEILGDSDLEGYGLLDANLNANTGKIGVYLAYQTTTDIEDAITDIAIMQMTGGNSAADTAKICREMGCKVVIPHHFDCPKDYTPFVEALGEELKKQAPEIRYIVPEYGEWISL